MSISASSFTALLNDLPHSDINTHFFGDMTAQVAYKELPAYLDILETYLQAQGIHRNDCVAFECQNSTAALLVLLALLYRGQHLLLLPPEGSPLKEPGFKPNIPAFCKTHITVSEGEDDLSEVAQLINHYQHEYYAASAFARIPTQGERLLLLRTSGSMGDAKIVRFSHAKLFGNAANCTQRFELKPQSRVTITVPVFHLYGLGAGFIPALLAGANINVQANTNILRFLENERSFKPDVVYLNPTLATMLLKGRRSKQPFAHTISAGAALPEKIYREYNERFGPMTNLYGSTEMGAAATTLSHREGNQSNRLLPMSGVKMQIDSANQALHCLHPYGFDGYLNSWGETLPVSTYPYNTGDVARHLEGGCIELLGRQSDSTNRAGFLVQFADIENALLRTGEVEQAVVLCSQQETVRGQKLYAFCIVKKAISTTQQITIESIRRACFEQLPRHAVPDEIILKEAFPLAPSGKVDRRLLQQHLPE